MSARLLLISGLALFASIGLDPHEAVATVMVPLSIEDMSKEASAVVRARVLEQHARWDEGRKRIFTYTKLEIIDPIHRRAALSPIVEVRTLGGEVDGLGMKVSGEARFTTGEQVVVFLTTDERAPGIFRVIGMSQGKYRVERDAEGRWMATPSLEGVAFAKKGTDGVLRVSEDTLADGRIGLEELRRRVLAALPATTPITPVTPTAPTAPATNPVHAPVIPNTSAAP